jgi:hypothetical protein
VQIVNVLNPASPTLIATYDSPGNAGGAASSGTVAYVADGAGLEPRARSTTAPADRSLDTPIRPAARGRGHDRLRGG